MNDEDYDPYEYYESVAKRYNDMYSEDSDQYPSQRICRDITVSIIESNSKNIETILDIGCGTGYSMYPFLSKGYEIKGFDFSPNMVEEAKKNLEEWGYDPSIVVEADLAKSIPYDDTFDAVIALGSVPSVPKPIEAFERIQSVTKPGGKILLQLRNLLFNIYSINEYTYTFYMRTLLNDINIPQETEKKLKSHFQKLFQINSDIGGYSQLDASGSFHNPLTIKETLRLVDIGVDELYFHHYHAFPPRIEDCYSELMSEKSLKMEDPHDWRGYLMASAFLVEATSYE